MQKKINSIWLYSIILFSVALMLILISALAQVNLSPDSTAQLSDAERQLLGNQTVQQTSMALAEENEKLKDDYARLESQYDEVAPTLAVYEKLFEAAKLLDEEKVEEAFELFKTIDTSSLSEAAGYWHTDLLQKLEQKGYTIND